MLLHFCSNEVVLFLILPPVMHHSHYKKKGDKERKSSWHTLVAKHVFIAAMIPQMSAWDADLEIIKVHKQTKLRLWGSWHMAQIPAVTRGYGEKGLLRGRDWPSRSPFCLRDSIHLECQPWLWCSVTGGLSVFLPVTEQVTSCSPWDSAGGLRTYTRWLEQSHEGWPLFKTKLNEVCASYYRALQMTLQASDWDSIDVLDKCEDVRRRVYVFIFNNLLERNNEIKYLTH